MPKLFRLIPVILTASLLAACAPKAAATKTASTSETDAGPRVSFASPEPGASVPFGPVQLLMLSEDPRGTSQAEVTVNGATVAAVPSPDTTRTSVIIEYLWQPDAPGKYVLQARAQNNNGTWGAYASLELTVGEAAAAAETPAPDLVPTDTVEEPKVAETDVIATQEEPEATVTPEIMATDTRSGISLEWVFTTLKMYKYGSACEPQQNSVIVSVSGLDKNAIGGVMLFFQPVDANTFERGKWTTGLWLELFPSGAYGRGFSTVHMVKKGLPFPYIPAIVNYQFAISDKGNTIIYRSPVYFNLQVAAC
jgi:hypothetical protein